jgi:hypothetical protein
MVSNHCESHSFRTPGRGLIGWNALRFVPEDARLQRVRDGAGLGGKARGCLPPSYVYLERRLGGGSILGTTLLFFRRVSVVRPPWAEYRGMCHVILSVFGPGCRNENLQCCTKMLWFSLGLVRGSVSRSL